MNKDELYSYLDECGISYEITNHEVVYNMVEVGNIELPYPEDEAKNLFVRDDKGRQYYLITVRGNRRVGLKNFRKTQSTRPLSFATEEELFDIMGIKPGSVTPLGLLNDIERRVIFFFEKSFLEKEGRIGCHPNDNTATVWMKTSDLINIIEKHGNKVIPVDLG